MKYIHNLLYLLALVVVFSSCGDINEEMWLNADGSGKLEYSVDLSSSLPMLQMMSQGIDSTQTGEGGKEMMDDFFATMGREDVDSTSTFYEMAPDSIKETVEGIEKLKKVSMNMKASAEDEIAIIKLIIDFDNFEEIDELMAMMGEMQGDGGAGGMGGMMGGMGGLDGFSFGDNQYFTKKFYKRRPMQQDGGSMADMMGEDSEAEGMMQMMFGNSDYIQTFHFPHKVKSVNISEASIKDNNTVVIERSMLDLMKSSESKEMEVTFKKKFLGIF